MKKNRYIFYFLNVYTIGLYANSETYHRYFWANYNHFAGNTQQASTWYTRLISSNPSPYSYKGYLHLLADTKKWNRIIQLMPTLNKKLSNDLDVQIILIQAYEQTNQMKKADEKVITLSQSHKTHPDITLRATQAYMRAQEPENALLTINNFLNSTPRRPNNFIFYYLLSHINANINQLTAALENIQKCLEIHPQFDKGWLLYAALKEKEGNIKEAISGYSHVLEIIGHNSAIEEHLFTLMLNYKSVENNKQFVLWHTPSISRALSLFHQKKYSLALNCIDKILSHESNHNEAKLLKIQILSTMKEFDKLASLLSSWIEAEPKNSMWPKILHLLTYVGMPSSQCINTLHTILEKQPDNVACALYCADIHMRNNHNDLAMSYLNKALQRDIDASLKGKILYQISLLHYEENHDDLMHSDLQKAYSYNPQCPYINNALAYYWVTKGKNPSKAYAFIEKALSIDPNNPYFIDTKALLLYKEKKYTQAQTLLEKINNQNNGTIVLHLAKTHYKLNNKEFAANLTKQAELIVKNNREKKALKKLQLLLAHHE